MVKLRRTISFCLLLAAIAGIFTGCAGKGSKTYQSLEDFQLAKIGIITGSAHDLTAQTVYPNATRVYFNNTADMILAVEQGRIHGYLEDAPFYIPLRWEGVDLKCIDEAVGQMQNGFVFPQGESTQLREQINEFIAESTSNGR